MTIRAVPTDPTAIAQRLGAPCRSRDTPDAA